MTKKYPMFIIGAAMLLTLTPYGVVKAQAQKVQALKDQAQKLTPAQRKERMKQWKTQHPLLAERMMPTHAKRDCRGCRRNRVWLFPRC